MKIVADSGCEYVEQFSDGIAEVEFVPLTLQLGDKEYIDDENLDVSAYLKAMVSSKVGPKTAAPSPELFANKFSSGESVFAITLSSKLSASYSNAMLAKKMVEEEKGFKGFIHVFDSLSASIGETMIALKIREYIAGKFSETEIVEKVNEFIAGMKTFYILDRYDNLVRNGRMEPYVATLASMLSIKPICTAINGEMSIAKKVRGSKRVFQKMAELIASHNLDFENRVLGISHVEALGKAEELRAEILKHVKFKDTIITNTKGLSSTYADKDGLIMTF